MKIHQAVAIVFSFFAMAAAPAAPADPPVPAQPAPARGQVLDQHGRAIAGAQLWVRPVDPDRRSGSIGGAPPPPVATSGEGGEFSFAEAAAGRAFDLVATRDGYGLAYLKNAAALPGEPLVLRMSPAGRLHGIVKGRGRPLDRAWVDVEPLDLTERDLRWAVGLAAASRSDRTGAYAVEGLAPGRYRLKVRGPEGLQTYAGEPVEIAAGESRSVDVELAEAAILFGRVRLPNGERVAGADVRYGRGKPGGVWEASTETDAYGAYRIERAGPGPAWLQVYAKGYRDLFRELVVEKGNNEVDLVLGAGSVSVAGRVAGPAGEPLAGATVFLSDLSTGVEDPAVLIQETGADGKVSFAGLDPGAYQLEIRLPGYGFAVKTIELAAGRHEFEWRMARATARLTGALAGLAPAERADLRVRAQAITGAEVPGSIEGESYVIDRLPAGRWTVIASSERTGAVVAAAVEIAEGQGATRQDLDFRGLAFPWIAEVKQEGQPLRGIYYTLVSESQGLLVDSFSTTGKIVIRALPGTYRLGLYLPPDTTRDIPIEIGKPSESVIDLDRLPQRPLPQPSG